MTHVLSAIEPSRASSDAVAAAIELAQEHGAELHFVGVVRSSPGPQPGTSRVLRRRAEVEHEARAAVAAAHLAGLEPSLVIRAGDPATALQREAELMTGEIVMAWPGRKRVHVAHLRQGDDEESLRLAA
jgi:nucleotide-binding universal stress UspA family protein